MGGLELVLVLVAGVLAGTVNTIVGAGTLLTVPLLVALLRAAAHRGAGPRGRCVPAPVLRVLIVVVALVAAVIIATGG